MGYVIIPKSHSSSREWINCHCGRFCWTRTSTGVICIHVNPPSFELSLRHFGIAENLRPGDEHLRHLTVTSRFKKIRLFLAIKRETQPSFTSARSRTRPTFHTMMTRTRKPDVSESDVSSKKLNLQKKKTGSPEVTRVAVMPSQNVSTFQKRWGRYCRGSIDHLFEIDATQFLELHILCCHPFIQFEPIYWKLSQCNLIQRLSSTEH